MDNKKEKDELKVEWFGIDGALVLLYVVLAVIYGYGIINRIDFAVGILAPFIAISITSIAFIKYCTEVASFAKGKKRS